MSAYADFLDKKRRVAAPLGIGLEAPLPDLLFPWQRAIVKWAAKKGRAAIFADCGLGKTFMQLAWAQAMGAKTLILAPLCVAEQTADEASKLGMVVPYARKQAEAIGAYSITNYERLDDFDLSQFGAVVLDESSILKAFDGTTRTKLIEACARVPYRLCCTATPSPNDISELANHAEFLGLMTRAEFLASWFIHDSDGWRMKGHARQPFYRWLASWAIAFRKPSDLGYSDDGFVLPELVIKDHILEVDGPASGSLFPEMGTKGLKGRLSARRASLESRTEECARLVLHHAPQCQWLVWCGLNEESETVAELTGGLEVSGADSYDEKRHAVLSFTSGETRTLISKPRILGYGMNFQHCHHAIFVGLGDSYEQYYQAIRRCWRFGQKTKVTAHIVISEAERVIVENVRRKEAAAADLSASLIDHMRDFEREELAV
jgi:superfamily II DNA or RNA helicase